MATDDQADDLNARTQNFFRDVNKRMTEVNGETLVYPSGGGPGQIEVVCECGRADCTTFLKITGDDYALVRANPVAFVLLAGHETASVERVIRRTTGYLITENKGRAALVARAGDPGGPTISNKA